MIELGLQRILSLLAKSPLPWRAIHVAGTNGKGSICHYISAMLEVYNHSLYRKDRQRMPLKHARFTSPHLVDRWDCITIDQQTVSVKLFDHVEKQVLRRNEHEGIGASEFELLTATAFEIFTHEEVDVGVVEVGMGGRLDATNVIGQFVAPESLGEIDPAKFRPPPLVTAISKLGLDHQAFLGNTLEEIAREKAGIMKPNVPVVWDTSNSAAVINVLKSIAANNRVVDPGGDEMPGALLAIPLNVSPPVVDLLVGNPARNGKPIPLQHQRMNLDVAFRSTWTALQELKLLPAQRPQVMSSAWTEFMLLAYAMVADTAFTETSYAGRLHDLDISTLMGHQRRILLDGAHNMQSAEVLANYVERVRRDDAKSKVKRLSHNFQNRPAVTWVVAASDTKDTEALLKPLLCDGDIVLIVEFGPVAGMPWVRPMTAESLAETARTVADVKVEAYGSDIMSALTVASETAAPDHMIVVTGSLYLVGDVLRLLKERTGKKPVFVKKQDALSPI